jgi:hypothetical protein
MEKPTFSELTNYQKIYSHTYWGNFRSDPIMHPGLEIIENRNKFITDYDIKRYTKPSVNVRRYIREERDHLYLDHVEYYRTIDNNGVSKILLITSPYKSSNELDFIHEYEKYGWLKIYPLYHTDAYTFAKYYDRNWRDHVMYSLRS